MSDPATDQAGLAQAARWFALAVEDLEGVRVIVRDHVMVARIGGFLAQQSAEKAIKAALIAQGTDPPKSHLLTDLFALLADAPPLDVRELQTLSPWVNDGRYAADLPDATYGEVEQLLDAAGRVVEAMRSLVFLPEPRPDRD